MEPTKRIVVNTMAQYAKAAVNICLSLYSMRLILDALTISDYGIFAVVGSVVALLGFVTNALVVTTQRYVSYYCGLGDSAQTARVFANSLFLHIAIGLAAFLCLLLLKPLFLGCILNIPVDRLGAAEVVYYATAAMLVITILSAPFKAMLIAHENIVYISVVEVIDGILKLAAAIALPYMVADKLEVYAFIMLGIVVFELFAYAIFSKSHYDECSIVVRLRDIDKAVQRQLLGFAGWTTYGAGAIVCRNQGLSMVLNVFFGTVVNAALGVAMQVYGALAFLATSLLNAMNPQIMQAEGKGDRPKAIALATKESKYSSAVIAWAIIPIMAEMPAILSVWLKEVPDYTVMFCRMILLSFLFDQLTSGLNTMCQAIGRLARYSLFVYTPKLLLLVVFYLILYCGGSLLAVMLTYAATELTIAIVRIPFVKRLAGLRPAQYISEVFVPLVPMVALECAAAYVVVSSCAFPLRFMATIVASVVVGGACFWLFTMKATERTAVLQLVSEKLGRQ